MRNEDMQDLVSKALRRAWQLGQTYCDQADSEYISHNKQADVTQARFHELIEETRVALAASAAEKEHELIDWDSAHKIAFQAAAAFRPSYFNGAGFMAHNWVVEAIRSGHIDGQRHALGLPPIDRSGANAAELRMERKATPRRPQPDDAVKEVMALVNTLIASINDAHHANSEGWRDGCFQAADSTYETIESKLRALLAQAATSAAPAHPQMGCSQWSKAKCL